MTNPTPTARVITLTPDMANEYLSRNTTNRKVSEKNLALIVRAIENGEWELNGEAIKIAADGRILDGQHRLLAVVKTGQNIETFIIEGLAESTQDTMDTGKSRSIADVLTIEGHANATSLAAVIRRIYIANRWGIKAATMASFPTTNREVLAFFAANPWIASLVPDAKQIAFYSKLPGSLAGMLMHEFQKIDSADAAFFFERLRTGENLAADSPIYALRRALQTLHDSKGSVNQTYLAAIAIKAWNKFRAGEPVGTLKFTPGGANAEKFPTPN